MSFYAFIKLIVPYFITSLSLITRIIPHPPNFTATNSAIIYSNMTINSYLSILIPVMLYFLEDIIRTYFIYKSSFTVLYVLEVHLYYLIVSILIKIFANKNLKVKKLKKIHFIKVIISIIFSSTLFFIWSNFIVYLNSSKTILKVYIDALPFYMYEFSSNILYTALFICLDKTIYTIFNFIEYKYNINNKNIKVNEDAAFIENNNTYKCIC